MSYFMNPNLPNIRAKAVPYTLGLVAIVFDISWLVKLSGDLTVISLGVGVASEAAYNISVPVFTHRFFDARARVSPALIGKLTIS